MLTRTVCRIQTRPRSFLTRRWDDFLPAPTLHPAARGVMASTLTFWGKTRWFVLYTLCSTCFSLRGRAAMETSRAPALPPLPSAAARFQAPTQPLGPWLFGCVTRRNLASRGRRGSVELTLFAGPVTAPGPARRCPRSPLAPGTAPNTYLTIPTSAICSPFGAGPPPSHASTFPFL